MKTENSNPNNATFVNPIHVRVSKDGRYLIIALPGNQLIRKPINYFRTILERLNSDSSSIAVVQGEGA